MHFCGKVHSCGSGGSEAWADLNDDSTLVVMNIRYTEQGIRVRLNERDTDLLRHGQTVGAALSWPGGGWSLRLDPAQKGVSAQGSALSVGLVGHLGVLLDPLSEGVSITGFGDNLNIRIEQDYLSAPRP
jgi:hypothetical protein